jgi:branched-chain amino acid transport system substrate-binding protein
MESRQEILVGLSISLTGRFSVQGRQALDGLRLWQSYVNGQDGITLREDGPQRVRLGFYDIRAAPTWRGKTRCACCARTALTRFFGPYSSGLTMAIAQVAHEQGSVLWNHGGSTDEIFNRGWRHLVSTPTPASAYLRDLPRWLRRQAPALRKICIVYSTRGAFASHVARGVVQAATSEYSAQLMPYSALNVDVLARELRASQPEILVTTGSFEQEIQIMQARRSLPASIQAIASVAAGVCAFRDELGRALEGVIGPSQWEARAGFPADIGPDALWFARNFQEQFGREPEYTAAGSFALGLIFGECVRRTGSLQDNNLLAAAAELDCSTFYGRFRLDSASGRQVGHRILLIQWDRGHKILLPVGKDE